MYFYQCYGLAISSELVLPELQPSSLGHDVTIRRLHVDRASWDRQLGTTSFRGGPDEASFCYQGIGAFLVRSGREILFDPDQGVNEFELRPFILGPMLSFLLHQRGLLVLHASSVVLGGGVVGFLGGAGWGKSSMAAALNRAGYPLVADDVTAVDAASDPPRVYAGPSQLKLWPEVVSALGQSPEGLPRVHQQLDKRWQAVTELPSAARLVLKRLYVLHAGTAPAIERIPARDAIAELVRHSYAVELLGATSTAAAHLGQCATIAAAVPLARLTRQRSLVALPTLVELVEHDATSAHG